jgi:hypothetical protein
MKKAHIKLIILLGFVIVYSCELIDDTPGTGDVRDRIEGQWKCDENSQIYKSTKSQNSQIYKSTESIYYVYIDPDPSDTTKIIISNFYNLGFDNYVYAKLNSLNLSISQQTTEDGFKILSGSGNILSNYREISLSYRVDDGSGEVDNVTATYTKE